MLEMKRQTDCRAVNEETACVREGKAREETGANLSKQSAGWERGLFRRRSMSCF